jgi:DNA gyrase subunit A
VKTAQLTEGKGRLAGARIVRDGYQVMLISDGGTVIRIPVDGIRRAGRATQGVIVMRLREGEQVATLAPVVGSDEDPRAPLVDADDAADSAASEDAPADAAN